MNTRGFKYLIALSELKHFRKAAEACFVSQPALSMQIKKLEETLGIKLLERTNKSVMLTKEGDIIAERARGILKDVDDLKAIAQAAQDPFSGEIKLGIFPTLAPYWLPKIMPLLAKQFPKISFYLIEEQTNKLIDQLKEGKVDAAFLAEPVMEKDFQHTSIFVEEFLVATPKSDALSKLKSIKQTDLEDKNILLLDEGHCLRDQALDVCHKMRIQEHQNFRATSLETLRHMVASGIGITLMPKLACVPTKNIVYIPFHSAKPSRKIALYWRKASSKQIVLEAMANILIPL